MLYFLLVIFCLFVALSLGKKKRKKHSTNKYFPVTIIKDGKSVTFNGYDADRFAQETSKVTAELKKAEMPRVKGHDSARLAVAVTGTLSLSRQEIAIGINSTKNARFVERVASNTDYLVAARQDTAKARAALANGTKVISEEQLFEYLGRGEFPTEQHRAIQYRNNGFMDEIEWHDTFDPPVKHRIEYADSTGEYSERLVSVLHLRGTHSNGYEYLGAYENDTLKTFRLDRVLKLERCM